MHTFLAFFSWPNGACWGNIVAVPPCAIVAAVLAFVFRDRIGRTVKGWYHRHLGHRPELERIHEKLAHHADLLNTDTPGGLTAVLAEVKDARQASEAALAAVQGLTKVVAPTQMRKTGRPAPKSGSEEKEPAPPPPVVPVKAAGMGSRVPPKTRREKP